MVFVVAPGVRGGAAARLRGVELGGLRVQSPPVAARGSGVDERVQKGQDGRISPGPVVEEADAALPPVLLPLPLPAVLVPQRLPLPPAFCLW